MENLVNNKKNWEKPTISALSINKGTEAKQPDPGETSVGSPERNNKAGS
jgi:hypothetical protein